MSLYPFIAAHLRPDDPSLPADPDPAMDTLAQLRAEAGISQRQMAVRLGVSPATISTWELGTRCPGIDRVRQYAQALGYDLDVVPR